MTKKDFILIARLINESRSLPIEIRETGKNPSYISHEDLVAEKFCEELALKNPRFNSQKFLKACGVEIDENWFCVLCEKKKENYGEGLLCDSCYDKENK